VISRFMFPVAVTLLMFGCLSPLLLPGLPFWYVVLIGVSCGVFAGTCLWTWWNR
jgi:hypothetical protein